MQSPVSSCRVVALPDLFVDTLVRLPPWQDARAALDALAAHGGGNLPVPALEVKLGGNAGNLAVALARLGCDAHLVTETDEAGLRLAQQQRDAVGLGIDHVRPGPVASTTLALECGRTNLMLSHAGPLATFGPERLTPAAWRLLESADAVAVTHWSLNVGGTRLLRAIVPRLARKGIFVYLDTADPRHRGPDALALLDEASVWADLGAWGLNENELRFFAGDRKESLDAAAARLARATGCRLDVHTRDFAASWRAGQEAQRVPAGRAQGRRSTGAGDSWNAGNLVGQLLGLPDTERLRLAHAVAQRFVTARTAVPPTWNDLPAGVRAQVVAHARAGPRRNR